MKKIWYSTNDQDYTYTDLHDAVLDVFDDPEIKVGDIRSVSAGEACIPSAGDLLPGDFSDYLAERAYDEYGEYSNGWPNTSKEQSDELMQGLKSVIDIWANRHKLQPSFFRVINTKEIRVKLLNDDGDYQVLDEAEQAV